MRPTKRNSNSGTVATLTLAAFLVVAVISILILYFMPNVNFLGESNEEEQKETNSTIIEIPEDSSDALNEQLKMGSLLTFGNREKGQRIALFVDPADLSRDKEFINGSPSEFLTSVQKGKVNLALFLMPSTPEREQFVKDVIKVGKCRQMIDRSTTSIFALNSIVSAGMDLQGNENIDQIAKKMKADMNACPNDIDHQVEQAYGNSKYFMETVFGVKEKTALVANGGLITDIFNLRDGWVSAIKEGVDPTLLVPRDQAEIKNSINLIN